MNIRFKRKKVKRHSEIPNPFQIKGNGSKMAKDVSGINRERAVNQKKEMADYMRRASHPPQQTEYYWVWGWDGNRRVIFGPFNTDNEANELGYQKLQTDYEVVRLNTRNEQEASRKLRFQVLDNTANLPEAMRRFRHKKSFGKGHTI